jgi:hypothetical protein
MLSDIYRDELGTAARPLSFWICRLFWVGISTQYAVVEAQTDEDRHLHITDMMCICAYTGLLTVGAGVRLTEAEIEANTWLRDDTGFPDNVFGSWLLLGACRLQNTVQGMSREYGIWANAGLSIPQESFRVQANPIPLHDVKRAA